MGWLTVQEAAEHMKCSTNAIYQHISKQTPLGRLFSDRGPKVLIEQETLDRYLRGEENVD